MLNVKLHACSACIAPVLAHGALPYNALYAFDDHFMSLMSLMDAVQGPAFALLSAVQIYINSGAAFDIKMLM